MTSTYEAWAIGKPIYSRLPGVNQGYQKEDEEGAIARWLTAFYDELLTDTKATIDDLPRQLDPQTCDAEWLDFLSQLSGFTGEYWDKAWPENVKRSILSNAFQDVDIWANKGTQAVLEWLLNLFEIEHSFWLGGGLLLDITPLPAPLGFSTWQYYITVELKYLRDSYKFKLAEQLNRLYSPAFADGRVVYDQFYLNFSHLDTDPFFV